MIPEDSPVRARLHSADEQETMRIGEAVGRCLLGGEAVLLHGEMGAGKTCFVRGLARGLGLSPDQVSSPTFIVCQEYTQPDDRGARLRDALIHMDAYRLRSADDIESIGWAALVSHLRAGHTVLAIEWPDRLGRAVEELPVRLDVVIEAAGPSSRDITVRGSGAAESIIAMVLESLGRSVQHRCRRCGSPIKSTDSAATLPFCSDRCRLSDLGKWMREEYRTSRAMEADDELNE